GSQSGDAGWPTAVESQTWCVGFAFGSARLDAKGRRVLEQVAARLPGKGRITIAGRTDSVGPAAANDALAKARAETVRGFLARLRPELEAAITVQAEGGCCFAAANDTATGRARNRRVEITLETMLAPP
ncbi:MAG: OmpA family protein, partial [Desulfovibrionaceae bacterium]|nr:OmpA family protein [Desulfovibrionaceae bacterium]